MFKIIWMSDLHYAEDEEVLGHDPRERLSRAIEHVNSVHSDAAFCVISGDMVDLGNLHDYKGLQRKLDVLGVPVLPMVGNHDNRDIFRLTMPVPDSCMTGFIQYGITTEAGRLLCLDTHKPGSDAGAFCEARMDWLRAELDAAKDTPVYLFMHHPPMALGLPMLDPDRLEDGEALLDLVTAYDCVKHLFIGHVHRPICETVRGVPFATMRSVLYQAPLPAPAWSWEGFRPAREAPGLGVLLLSDAGVLLQHEEVCGAEEGVVDP